ncbi:MAG TPA: S-methyl-5'-thioadenosine phosphorylase [Bryobacteraceae bacterium]|nr:S-methyl-5'-thioadenosine phosphorylase [Bryobacteraceae bacterium]
MREQARKIADGDTRVLARTATGIENRDPDALAVLEDLAPLTGRATIIGITGAPGAGKSTLVDALARALRQEGRTVGILAIDPTSRVSGGAILGDRIRMQAHHADPGIFIRSMATRGSLGGLAQATGDIARLLDAAGRDYVIIETVGVGQDEIEIAGLAQVTVVVLVPGMGDDIQAIKAGIMEIADVFAINKSDHPGAERIEHEIRSALELGNRPDHWTPPIIRTIAPDGRGIPELLTAIREYRAKHAPVPQGESRLKAEIGIIGGSGLYSMPGFEAQEEISLDTPFGKPSDSYVLGELNGHKVAFLARHGRGHRLSPSELNFRANIFGMKTLGVERILSLSAVGSLKEEHRPLDFVIPDQFVDRTNGRISTFFGEGLVAHISFGDPICPQLADVVEGACQSAGVTAKRGGAYICMEGPAFSTKAESNLYRSWGMDVIGMTNLQEAKLAREAEICYVTIAMVTDYDCWHPDHDAVTVNDIIAHLVKNAENACKVVAAAVASMPAARCCKCGSALSHAILTDRSLVPAATLKKLEPIVGKYFV